MKKIRNIAHVRQNKDETWTEHLLVEHLKNTARKACEFAKLFNAGDWAEIIALWHDLGKFVPDWQKYIRQGSGYDLDAHIETLGGKVNHSSAGAVLAFQKLKNCLPIARIIGYPIVGHHAGLPDWYPAEAPGFPLPERISKNSDMNNLDMKDLSRIMKIEEAIPFLKHPFPKTAPFGKANWRNWANHLHLWIRMIYSSLVDADFLDTEEFMSPENKEARGGYLSLLELKERFDLHMTKLGENAPSTPINRRRDEILKMCRKKAHMTPGFFSLTVPTGGGKTLSSIAFALEHALKYNKRRIIVGIPYTSIIEQTAKVLKFGTDDNNKIKKGERLFGEENVLEHHSNIDSEEETHRNRLAAENWDVPVIVTTNVQLFESLFSSKSSSCRKLHNIVDSVIILDEAQMLPPEYLKPILSVLQALVEHFGVTVVLCTATQPVLTGSLGRGKAVIQGLSNCREIVDEPSLMAEDFKRVNLHFPLHNTPQMQWEEIAAKILEYPQCLAIVNTRNACRTLYSLLPEETKHLSAFMCGEERSDVINEIKNLLREELPVRVVSTQLVEAGVDIDFPVVFRAMAGLDSIAQSAGRCNREGKLNRKGERGNVFVFISPQPSPSGLLRKGEDACKSLLRTRQIKSLDPEVFTEYFRNYYGSINSFDTSNFEEDLCKEASEFKFQFRSQSQKFKLIDDTAQRGIVIWYRGRTRKVSSLEYIEQLRLLGPSRQLFRKMQRYTVNVPLYTHKKLMEMGMIEEISGFSVQRSPGLYKPGLGLLPFPDKWCQEILVI